MTADDTAFEREKLCYVENSEHARHLNTNLNAIPALAVTITGGLWFGAAATEGLKDAIRFALLILAGLSDVVLIFAAFRVRNVFEGYLEVLKAFHPPSFPPERPNNAIFPTLSRYSMIKMYCGLILIAAVASFVGAFGFYWPLPNKWIVTGIVSLGLLMGALWVLITKGWGKSVLLVFLGFLLLAATIGITAQYP